VSGEVGVLVILSLTLNAPPRRNRLKVHLSVFLCAGGEAGAAATPAFRIQGIGRYDYRGGCTRNLRMNLHLGASCGYLLFCWR
jgi:hypothetical protein